MRVQFSRREIGARSRVEVRLGTELFDNRADITWTYASHAENDRQATEANRRHDFGAARHVLERTADRIRGYAGDDRALQDLATSLREETARFAEEAMSPMMLKSAFYVAESEAKYRNPEGRARRRTT